MKLLPQSSRILNNMLISLERYLLYLRFIGPSGPHKHTGGIKGIPPCLPYLGIPWRRVVSFMLQPLFNRAKSPRYPLHKLLKAHTFFCSVGKSGSFKGSEAVRRETDHFLLSSAEVKSGWLCTSTLSSTFMASTDTELRYSFKIIVSIINVKYTPRICGHVCYL